MADDPVVYVVDDDEGVRNSLESLIRSVGLSVQTFASAQEFLKSSRPDVTACLVTDLRMPGLNGLDLQQELARSGWQIPIVFITGHGDVPTSVRAMKAGAIEFLTKPFREQVFLDAVGEALKRDRARREQAEKLGRLRLRYRSLTPREHEVLRLMAEGRSNSAIAEALVITDSAVAKHINSIFAKLDLHPGEGDHRRVLAVLRFLEVG